jgi:hypothetical protein
MYIKRMARYRDFFTAAGRHLRCNFRRFHFIFVVFSMTVDLQWGIIGNCYPVVVKWKIGGLSLLDFPAYADAGPEYQEIYTEWLELSYEDL